MEYRIIKYNKNYKDELINSIINFNKEKWKNINFEIIEDNFKNFIKNKNIFIIIWKNFNVYGFLIWEIKKNNNINWITYKWHISLLYINNDIRGFWFWKKLILTFEKYLLKKWINKLSLLVYKNNNIAIWVYEKLNFKKTKYYMNKSIN